MVSCSGRATGLTTTSTARAYCAGIIHVTPRLTITPLTLADAEVALLLLLEPVEQPPDEPLTLDEVLMWCVLDELLQLNAIAECVGIAVIERIVPSNTAITGTITNIGLFFILYISSGLYSDTSFYNINISRSDL